MLPRSTSPPSSSPGSPRGDEHKIPIQFLVPVIPGFPDAAGAHAHLTAFCSMAVPPAGQRVSTRSPSGTTGKSGALAHGYEGRAMEGKKDHAANGSELFSPQLVIAIFDGKPAMVVTDCWPAGLRDRSGEPVHTRCTHSGRAPQGGHHHGSEGRVALIPLEQRLGSGSVIAGGA